MKMQNIESGCYRTEKYFPQARPPERFTGCGSEGVKGM